VRERHLLIYHFWDEKKPAQLERLPAVSLQ